MKKSPADKSLRLRLLRPLSRIFGPILKTPNQTHHNNGRISKKRFPHPMPNKMLSPIPSRFPTNLNDENGINSS